MSQKQVGWNRRDLHIVRAVYTALGQLQVKLDISVMLNQMNYASLKYSKSGLICWVKLPGVKATVETDGTGSIFFNVKSVSELEYLVAMDTWEECEDVIHMRIPKTSHSRGAYIDTELSMHEDRKFFLYRVLSMAYDSGTADSFLRQTFFDYPQLTMRNDQMIMNYRHLDDAWNMGIYEIEIRYDYTHGYVFGQLTTRDGIFTVTPDPDENPFSGILKLQVKKR